MREYVPVPVEAARQICQRHQKDIAVILSWDAESNLVDTTTYGVTPRDKRWAATLGDILTKAAGCDPINGETFEDFRTRTQSEWAAEREAMVNAFRQAHEIVCSAIDDPAGISRGMMCDISAALGRFLPPGDSQASGTPENQ